MQKPSTLNKSLNYYLDFQATTPMEEDVFNKMVPFLTEHFGNPSSSSHRWGWAAHNAVELARIQVANLLNCEPFEIYFTSGATESNNLVIQGLFHRHLRENQEQIFKMITTKLEHKSILSQVDYFQNHPFFKKYFSSSFFNHNEKGFVEVKDFLDVVPNNSQLVSVHWGNNELGILQNINTLGEKSREAKIYFHTDATQCVGKIPIDLKKLPIDLLSLSAHKFGGPKGVGALYVRNSNPCVQLDPLIFGGGQERGLRSGTLNVASIVGLGEACVHAKENLITQSAQTYRLREHFLRRLHSELPQVKINTDLTSCLPHALSINFVNPNISQAIATSLELGVSAGSACNSITGKGSYILEAVGLSSEAQNSTVRISFSSKYTIEDVDHIFDKIKVFCVK